MIDEDFTPAGACDQLTFEQLMISISKHSQVYSQVVPVL